MAAKTLAARLEAITRRQAADLENDLGELYELLEMAMGEIDTLNESLSGWADDGTDRDERAEHADVVPEQASDLKVTLQAISDKLYGTA
jgi:hypothetical protein